MTSNPVSVHDKVHSPSLAAISTTSDHHPQGHSEQLPPPGQQPGKHDRSDDEEQDHQSHISADKAFLQESILNYPTTLPTSPPPVPLSSPTPPGSPPIRRSGRARKVLRENLSDHVAAVPFIPPPEFSFDFTPLASIPMLKKKISASGIADQQNATDHPPASSSSSLPASPLHPDPAAQKVTLVSRSKVDRPRWYNQTYIVYLVLRQANRPLNRRELIPAVLELEQQISSQRGLPRLFNGKTPQNTCSGLLTNNSCKLFTRMKMPGDIRDYFQLSFEPGSFESAVASYNQWMKTLIEIDWPVLFGSRESSPIVNPAEKGESTSTVDATDTVVEDKPKSEPSQEPSVTLYVSSVEKPSDLAAFSPNPEVILEPSGDVSAEPTQTAQSDEPVVIHAEATKDEDIPTALDQVVQVRESSIPGAGRGLFALRDIPPGTILGFYFGVPMTEDEFDAVKQHVGMADEYSHRYKNMVLDATDVHGQPYTDHPLMFCPFHFMNELKCKANMVFIDGHIVNQVLCIAKKRIRAGEELFVDYGTDVDREKWSAAGPSSVPSPASPLPHPPPFDDGNPSIDQV